MEEAQPDPRTDVELHVPVVGIVVLLRELLGLNEALTNLGEDIITRPQPPYVLSPAGMAVWVAGDGRTPPQMASREGRCGRRYCNNTPPTTASRPKREGGPL